MSTYKNLIAAIAVLETSSALRSAVATSPPAAEAEPLDCAICQEPGADATTHCNHMFHEPCMLQWALRKHTFAVCRAQIHTLPTDEAGGGDIATVQRAIEDFASFKKWMDRRKEVADAEIAEWSQFWSDSRKLPRPSGDVASEAEDSSGQYFDIESPLILDHEDDVAADLGSVSSASHDAPPAGAAAAPVHRRNLPPLGPVRVGFLRTIEDGQHTTEEIISELDAFIAAMDTHLIANNNAAGGTMLGDHGSPASFGSTNMNH